MIIAPNREYNGKVGDVQFKDGTAETNDQAVIQYCRSAGYEVDGEIASPPESPEPPDPREVGDGLIGTPLRDAAVDPREGDFLPPTNAGQANPHGPEVVAPGIHAVSGPGPIVPGPVGRIEQTDEGGQVVITDTAEQQRRETTAAEQVFVEQRPVPEVTADLGDRADAARPDAPAGNASQEAWADWVIATHPELDEASVRGMKRDELREQYGPKAE
ncbi:hypothetical protein [Micromonospora sp. LHW51205]|uniref:hypothetical protein n=1 Tax=Micromonospora sp. LHW51205 TaxID=2248752 RepID=UPI0011BFC18A|nr:hypothetical protein [Micromonospora sp. LHW51205]